ncbi:MAG: iron ABC transporter permease [Pseudooceanicola sp.]|jgi:predicted secreted hydrolase|nr:iron ABC transporter permease [Pseudooceanicola sp.]|tara:strand:+ start:359 stop:1432 length:1074 start_codon:yes stop_codon:yes gene_type:complete
MNASVAAILLWLTPLACTAQGFAGLGTTADGFTTPRPETALDFPADHGAHPDFRIEWWYLTATLHGDDGQDYGVQWTLFRSALRPERDDLQTGWDSPQIWMGHAALTSARFHHMAERLARGGIGQAGVTASPFSARIDDWTMASPDPEGIDRLTLTARGDAFVYDLSLEAQGPLVRHGANGYSVKSREGQASYYYSQPAYKVTGTIATDAGEVPVTGQGWLDREWSSQPLAEGQTGWDWFSLSFDSGARLMAFRLRDGDSGFTSATWIGPDGSVTPYGDGAVAVTPLATSEVAGRTIPTRWQVTMPARDLDVTVSALNSQAWMDTSFAYWEGPVGVSGSHDGRGYLEMTGYEQTIAK